MILFLDTEFTGLGQRWPRLISIGLVSEDGQQSFYAELAAESYMEKVTPWVQANVLPLLDGGEGVVQPDELRQRLAAWLRAFDSVQIACDAQDYDMKFLEAILDPLPWNVKSKPLTLLFDAEPGERFADAVEAAFAGGLRRHHALDDAKANRLGWIACGDVAAILRDAAR